MTSEQLFTTILGATYTTTDFHRRLSLLRIFLEKKYFTANGNLSTADFVKSQNPEQSDATFLASLGDEFYSAFTHENIYKILDDLEAELKKAPMVILYVPLRFPPPEVEKIGMWFRQNLPVNVIVDMKVDSAAFGGCMFVWNGYMSDYSLRYLLMKHKDDVSNVIGKYSPQPQATNPSNSINSTPLRSAVGGTSEEQANLTNPKNSTNGAR